MKKSCAICIMFTEKHFVGMKYCQKTTRTVANNKMRIKSTMASKRINMSLFSAPQTVKSLLLLLLL